MLRVIFTLPAGVEIGRHHFSVRVHAEGRVLKMEIFFAEPYAANHTCENGDIRSVWLDTNFSSPEPEGCAPGWEIVHPWIQVSECPDWQTVAHAVLDAWKETEQPGDGLSKLVGEVITFSPDLPARITRAIELIQDGFRYLSVNLELGGQIPAATDDVIRRRYGDCKDLAFLLTRLLQALGVSARPVLVNAVWRKSISQMLPASNVFNHVVVEYEIQNEKRWVDATAKRQGGGALGRFISDFGLGLPIDAGVTALRAGAEGFASVRKL